MESLEMREGSVNSATELSTNGGIGCPKEVSEVESTGTK
jgi:hypothetical protein